MTYKQKLTKIGNSVGVILPKVLLDSLGLKEGNELYIENIKDKIVLKTDNSDYISPEFLKVAEGVGKKYKTTFEELASK